MKKYKIYISKTKLDFDNDNNEFIHLKARPCKKCIEMLQYYGIRKAVYTMPNDEIITIKLNDLDTELEFVSDCQKLFNPYLKS